MGFDYIEGSDYVSKVNRYLVDRRQKFCSTIVESSRLGFPIPFACTPMGIGSSQWWWNWASLTARQWVIQKSKSLKFENGFERQAQGEVGWEDELFSKFKGRFNISECWRKKTAPSNNGCVDVPFNKVQEDISHTHVARVVENPSQGGDYLVYVWYSGLTGLVHWVDRWPGAGSWVFW